MTKLALIIAVLALAAPVSALADPGHGQGQAQSHQTQGTSGANGQCPGGPYCSTRDGSASQNGNGNGQATGKPCAGCVGNADDKNPAGQQPGGSDGNSGYECDSNQGIGQGNPAHSGCSQPTTPPLTPPSPPTGPTPPLSPTPPNAPLPPTVTPAPLTATPSGPTTQGTTKADVCKNIKGVQAKVPKGLVKKGTSCLKPKPKVKVAAVKKKPLKKRAKPHVAGKKIHIRQPKMPKTLPYTP